ncbi:PQQ-binding-like beta-propeller repeat protein [bacterium]|nr:PQQ-binding-like beta-propeller repeat protein [bacterium]
MSSISPETVQPVGVEGSRPIRLWPAFIIVALMLGAGYLFSQLQFDNPGITHLAQLAIPLLAAMSLMVWWLFFSCLKWRDRLVVPAIIMACYFGTFLVADASMPIALILSALPRLILVGIVWLVISIPLKWPLRRAGLVLAVFLTCGYYTLLRFEGISGEFSLKLDYRWKQTAEENYVTSQVHLPTSDTVMGGDGNMARPGLVATKGDWTAFRGADGVSVYQGPPIPEDWSKHPLQLLWKRRIGPGWGSVVIVGSIGFTQEQRGHQEVVTAFQIDTGEPIWEFAEEARFEEALSGAGPRSTPLFQGGKLYSVGATGRLNCLEALTGEKVWGTSIVRGENIEVPQWGYACSPIIVGDVVIVLPGKPDGAAITAFDAKTGNPLWAAADGDHSYTSAQYATMCDIPQILAFTSVGLTGILPDSGKVLWKHEWSAGGYARCVQPYVQDDTIVISTYFGLGIRKVKVTRDGETWKDEIVWDSKGFKPYFNDMVVVGKYAYGFDNTIFACLDLATGQRQWKGGRYGCGQVLLLEKQRKLLVISEQGEAVLLDANSERHVELAKFQALDGKTWNHPVIAHGKLFVRNSEEMACYDVRPTVGVPAESLTQRSEIQDTAVRNPGGLVDAGAVQSSRGLE